MAEFNIIKSGKYVRSPSVIAGPYKANIATLKDSGIVTYIGKKKGYNNTVIIQQSNGYYAWYGNIKENVKLYDFIEKGSVIGSSLSNEYYYALFKDDKKVSINEN